MDEKELLETNQYESAEQAVEVDDNACEEAGSEFELVEVQNSAKKTCVVQKPVIITALCFLLTALIVVGTVLIYNAFSKPRLVFKDRKDGIEYAWQLLEYNGDDYSEKNIYAEFTEDGDVNFYENGIRFYGKYTTEENDEGQQILKSDFYIFGMSGGEGIISDDSDRDNMTITFSGTDKEIIIKLKKSELPKINLEPENITHASADEVGLDGVVTDEKILGTWKELMDEYYLAMGYTPMKCTFNSDGTGAMGYDYTFNESYNYGYGMEFGFKYTIKDNTVYLTSKYFDGETKDMILPYGLSGGNLVLGGVGYEKAD